MKRACHSIAHVFSLGSAEWFKKRSFRVLFKAFEDAGSLDKEKVRQALLKMVMPGAVIPKQTIFFPKSNNYQINNPFIIVQNKPGKKVDIIYPKDSTTGEGVVPRPQ